jgi:hypothetical protein
MARPFVSQLFESVSRENTTPVQQFGVKILRVRHPSIRRKLRTWLARLMYLTQWLWLWWRRDRRVSKLGITGAVLVDSK